MRCEIMLATPRALAAVQSAVEAEQGPHIAVFATRGASPADREDFYSIGTLARIVNLGMRSCCHRWVTQVIGQQRVRSLEYVRCDPFREARVEPLVESVGEPLLVEGLSLAVRRAILNLQARRPRCNRTRRARAAVERAATMKDMAAAVADLLVELPVEQRQALLEAEPLNAQLQLMLAHLHGLEVQNGGAPTGTARRAAH
jgi:Lon protease-like protein